MCARTTRMANHQCLPQEITDHVVDLLHDHPATLKRCSVVSKSWVPRTRSHLFSHVTLNDWDYARWKTTFPDPANSPGCHVRTLTIDGSLSGVEESSWVEDFSQVERLFMFLTSHAAFGRFLPFHTLSPCLRALHVFTHVPNPQIFNLICSLPLLEDLTLNGLSVGNGDGPQIAALSTSPALTGTLEAIVQWTTPTLSLLLHLPGGLHFRKLKLWACKSEEDICLAADLVTACSDTLECLDVTCSLGGAFCAVSLFWGVVYLNVQS